MCQVWWRQWRVWLPRLRRARSERCKASNTSSKVLNHSPAPDLFDRQIRKLDHRADFDRAHARSRDAAGNADCFIEVAGLHHEVAAEVFARLRKRTVRHQALAVAHADAGGGGGWLQRGRAQVLA